MHSGLPPYHELLCDEFADFSGFVHPLVMKMAERLRLSAPPVMQFADSLRLCALFVHSTHENCGASQALCTPMMKLADRLGLCAPPSRKMSGASQALCTPMMKIADSLRL